jgi:hypothetical protein
MSCHFTLPDNIGSAGYNKRCARGLDVNFSMCLESCSKEQHSLDLTGSHDNRIHFHTYSFFPQTKDMGAATATHFSCQEDFLRCHSLSDFAMRLVAANDRMEHDNCRQKTCLLT